MKNIESKCINKFDVIKFECNMLYSCTAVEIFPFLFLFLWNIYASEPTKQNAHSIETILCVANGKWNEAKQNNKLNAKTFPRKNEIKKLLYSQITMRFFAIVLHVVLCCRHNFSILFLKWIGICVYVCMHKSFFSCCIHLKRKFL